MVNVVEKIDHRYQNEETGETFTLVWRHITLEAPIPYQREVLKELFMPPDSKMVFFPQEAQDGTNHFVVSGWWGREVQ
jgi:hypothetical protein